MRRSEQVCPWHEPHAAVAIRAEAVGVSDRPNQAKLWRRRRAHITVLRVRVAVPPLTAEARQTIEQSAVVETNLLAEHEAVQAKHLRVRDDIEEERRV